MHNSLFEYFAKYQREHTQTSLYGIFDGVKCPMLYERLEEGILPCEILFAEEEMQKALEEVAPYLVRLDFTEEPYRKESKALLEYYGKQGCIFAEGTPEFDDLLKAARELFYVYTPQGEKGYMRFYDPRVFRDYIAQKDDNIRYALFNQMVSYWCEDTEDASIMHQYKKESAYTYSKEPIVLQTKETT